MTSTIRAIGQCFNPLINIKRVFVRSGNRYQAIDGIRGLAMLYILLTHAMVVFIIQGDPVSVNFITKMPWYLQWALMGDKAVDAFFVLSGFLIGKLLLDESKKTGGIALTRFYVRRWLRLTPVYWFFLVIFLLFAAGGVNKNYIFSYAFYLNNFLQESHRYIPWLWSLAVEEQFYLVFPLFLSLFLLKSKQPLVWLVALFVLSLLIRFCILLQQPDLLVSGNALLLGTPALNDAYNQALYINLYTRFGPFIMGIMLAYGVVYYKNVLMDLLSYRFQLLLTGCIAIIILVFLMLPIYSGVDLPRWLYYVYHVGHRHLFALMVCLVILLSLKPLGVSRLISRVLSSKILYPFAQLSYPMYLFHLPILFLTWEFLDQRNWISGLSVSNMFFLTGVTLIPLMLLSLALHLLVEVPFIRLREVKWHRAKVSLCDSGNIG